MDSYCKQRLGKKLPTCVKQRAAGAVCLRVNTVSSTAGPGYSIIAHPLPFTAHSSNQQHPAHSAQQATKRLLCLLKSQKSS